jgi:beta-glucosidase
MFDSPGIGRLGIPGFVMSDGPHGVRMSNNATAFPISVALTATWDPAYMEIVGAAYGSEFKANGKNMALGPAVDIGRDPRNGRASETIGEEPYLGGKIFAAFTRGVQSTKLIATVKHFLAQNHDGVRDQTNPIMDERTMREFYGLPFRMVVQEGEVYSVMSAYNLVNGKHCSQNADALIQMLKNEWGYQYFIVSDWWGTYDLPENLMNSGLDMEMPDNAKFNGLKDAVYDKKITMNTLDMAVRRTLRSRLKSGVMDNNPTETAKSSTIENQIIGLEAGKKSIVLLKNSDNILPLKKTGIIALIGPNANILPITSFGSSEIQHPAYTVSTRQGITNVAPSVNVLYEKGCDINS